MVKNIPTIERSTKIRFGKYANDNQAENTIVFNASNAAISATTPGSVYMTPLREASIGSATFIGYDASTKEVVDTGVASSLLGGISLDDTVVEGPVVSNGIPHFANTLTAFTTRYGSNVGIANTSPIHALDVGEKLYITRHGNVHTSGKITAGKFYGDGSTLSNMEVGLNDVVLHSNTTTKTVEFNNVTAGQASLITAGKVGISNADPTHTLDVGSNLYVDDTAANVLDVTGNINVSNYLKTNKLEVSSLEVDAVTSGTVSSNIIGNNVNVITVTANVIADNVVATNGMYGNIKGSNTINASTISAITINSNVVSDNVVATNIGLNSTNANVLLLGPSAGNTTLVKLQPYDADSTKKFLRSSAAGVAWDDVSSNLESIVSNGPETANITSNTIQFTNEVTSLTASGNVVVSGNVTTGTPIAIASGGTGLNSFTENDLLLGPASGETALTKLAPYTTDSTKKFLRSNNNGVAWDDVSSNLESIVSNGPASANITSNTIQFTNGVTSLTASGNVVVTGNVTASTIKSTSLTSGKIPYTNADKELIDSKVSFNTSTNVTSVASNLVVTGNLTVQGGTTFQDSNIHTVSDPIIEIGNANAIDNIDMGIIMTRPTANVVAGFRGFDGLNEYTIAYTLSDPDGPRIIPTYSEGYITANVWGNVVASNVTTTGKMTADTFHGTSINVTGSVTGATLVGDGSAITHLDLSDSTHTGLNDLITLGTHTTGNYVQSISGGNGITAGGAAEGGTPTVAIDTKADGGLVIESGKLALDLQATSITGKLGTGDGGTGVNALAAGEILYGSGNDTMSKLATTNGSGKFLKLNGTTPLWADVSSNLESIVSNGPASANITSNTIQFSNTVNSLTASGNVVVSGNVISTGVITLESSAGTRQALKVLNAIEVDPSYATSSHNVLSINRTTGEIYDSGGQGGSTLANIIEEGANVAIGPSAASANLTVNTYGSNVLTVSGNVSADNITIGALHVSASPFNFDDVVSTSAGANVTANVITVGGLVASGNVEAGNVIVTDNITVTGNATSQNIKLTNTEISATISSGTITIDAREKSYGTAPLVTSTDDVSNLVFTNLISGSQIVVPILASGGNIKISKELTNVNFYAMTSDVSVDQDKHALMTLSNVSGNIYMNALAFA